jgi:hypothetical protein
MKLNYIFLSLFIVLVFNSCSDSEVSFPEIAGEAGFTGDRDQIEEFFEIDPSLFDEFLGLGLTVNEGANPPIINGTYLVSPYALSQSNVPNETFSAGDVFADLSFTTSNQNTDENTLDYVEIQAGNVNQSFSSLVSGSGNRFTAFFRTTSQVIGTDGNSIDIINGIAISGEITTSGITDYQYVFVITEKTNDINNEIINVGEGRSFIDSDGLVNFQ